MNRRQFLEETVMLSALMPGLALLPSLEAFAQAVHERARATPGLRTLSAAQDATVSRIADILLPQTDTVGASAVGVNRFVDLLLTESMLEEQRDRFLAGLAEIDKRCQAQHGTAFVAASPAQQEGLIRDLDQHLPKPASSPKELAARLGAPVTAESAYAQLKEIVVFGYFTCEPVAKGLINAPIIPGRYDGCIRT